MEYECCICLERLFSADTEVFITSCGHAFHKNCISNVTKGDNKKCPICREELPEEKLVKVHLNVNKELDYSDCSNDTLSFFDNVVEYEADKRMTMVKIIKKLDKENTHLKETYKTNRKAYSLCKLLLRGFQKEINNLHEKISKLKLTKGGLVAEIRRFFNEKEEIIEEENSEVKENEIDVDTCEDAINNIEAVISRGLFICYCLNNLIVYVKLIVLNRIRMKTDLQFIIKSRLISLKVFKF